MVLGELYRPKGLALETAQAVLEIENPFALNPAWGCPNGCKYPCHNHLRTKGTVRFPERHPMNPVENQMLRGLHPDGVFMSFRTDIKESWPAERTRFLL